MELQTHLKVISNITLRIGAFEEEGVVEITTTPTHFSFNNTHFLMGSTIQILECLQLVLKFSSPSISIVNAFLDKDLDQSNGYGKGTVAQMLAGDQLDLVVGYLYLLSSRANVSHVLWPFLNEKFNAFFVQPSLRSSGLSQNAFDKQFSAVLFLACFSLLSTAGLLLACSMTIHQFNHQIAKNHAFVAHFKAFHVFVQNLKEATFWSISTAFQQGYTIAVRDIRTMYVIVWTSVFSVGLYALYCALTTAALTRHIIPVTMFKDLFRFKYTFYAYEHTKSRLLAGVDSKLIWVSGSLSESASQEESVRRIFSHLHAHLDTPDLFYPTLLNDLPEGIDACEDISVVRSDNGRLQAGYYVRKNFPFRNNFNIALGKTLEAGLARRIQSAFIRQRSLTCPQEKVLYQRNLGMSFLGTAFTGLSVAFLFTFLLFACEHYWSWTNLSRPFLITLQL